MLKYFFPLIALSLIGCASAKLTSKFSLAKQSDKKALIYLYRLKTIYHSLDPDVPSIYFNDKKIGPLKIGGYFAQEVEPGKVEISFSVPLFGIPMWRSSRKVNMNVKAGYSYFVKYEEEMMGFYFDPVPAAQGLREIRTTRLLKQ